MILPTGTGSNVNHQKFVSKVSHVLRMSDRHDGGSNQVSIIYDTVITLCDGSSFPKPSANKHADASTDISQTQPPDSTG